MTFDDAAQAVLAHLREHVPMAFWSVTRVENGRQSYLYLNENGYGLTQGASHPWEASFCIHVAAGTAPTIAPVAHDVPLYANAEINKAVQIRSYAGAVINEPTGALFGVICGIDPEAKPDDERLTQAAPLLALLGQLLTMVLAADRTREQLAGLAVTAELASETDSLTGLYNRRAWDRILAEEEASFRRFGDPTVLAILDLDQLKVINDSQGHAAGDDYIRRAADALRASVRETDFVARLGGDEFGVLLRSCDEAAAELRVQQMYAAQAAAGVTGSVGWAPITILRGFPAALAEADSAMYEAKRARRPVRAHSA